MQRGQYLNVVGPTKHDVYGYGLGGGGGWWEYSQREVHFVVNDVIDDNGRRGGRYMLRRK